MDGGGRRTGRAGSAHSTITRSGGWEAPGMSRAQPPGGAHTFSTGAAAGLGRDVLPGHARLCPGEKSPASPGQRGGGSPGHRPTRLDCSPGARPLPRITSPDPATPPHCGDSPYFRSAARPGCPQPNRPLPTGQRGCAEEPAGQADLPSRRRARAGRTLLSS